MTWVLKARLAIATDASMAAQLDSASLTRAAFDGRYPTRSELPGIMSAIIAADTTITAATLAAITTALSTLQVPNYAVVTDVDYETAVTDAAGRASWMQAGTDGLTNPTALAAIVNATHLYAGPDQPYVYTGNWVLWTKTDSARIPIEQILVEA